MKSQLTLATRCSIPISSKIACNSFLVYFFACVLASRASSNGGFEGVEYASGSKGVTGERTNFLLSLSPTRLADQRICGSTRPTPSADPMCAHNGNFNAPAGPAAPPGVSGMSSMITNNPYAYRRAGLADNGAASIGVPCLRSVNARYWIQRAVMV